MRFFGPEYIMRERDGSIYSTVRKMFENPDFPANKILLMFQCKGQWDGVTYGVDTRRCSGTGLAACRRREKRPHEFQRCPCRRMAYCSKACMQAHAYTHAAACRFAANHYVDPASARRHAHTGAGAAGTAVGTKAAAATTAKTAEGATGVGKGVPLSCGSCGKEGATKTCARCKAVKYCSQACQRAAWKAGHRRNCKR